MITITIKDNFPQVQREIDAFGKQARFATAVALTRTAQDVRKDLQGEMRRAFDRPTPFTLNSLFIKPATRESLVANVWVKDSERPTHYIKPQIEGGDRPQKRFEQLLRQRGILGADEVTVPGAGAKLDASGNMSRAQIVQIISQLQAFNLAGASQNATDSRRSKGKRSQVRYFYARQRESRVGGRSWKGGEKVQHLPTGIYAKTVTGAVIPVLVIVDGANYSKRYRFREVATRTVQQRFPGHFDVELRKALATARRVP